MGKFSRDFFGKKKSAKVLIITQDGRGRVKAEVKEREKISNGCVMTRIHTQKKPLRTLFYSRSLPKTYNRNLV
jgi:hypothetical protein